MAKPLTATADQFWKKKFDEFGNAPWSWVEAAFRLSTSAEHLENFYVPLEVALGPFTEPKRLTKLEYQQTVVLPVACMLRAMATECLLKALWLKYGGKLAQQGQFTSIPGVKNHALGQMADAVSKKGTIRFSKTDRELLERASLLIETGRYPIPKNYLNSPMLAKAFKGHPVVELRKIMAKLENELGIPVYNFAPDSSWGRSG